MLDLEISERLRHARVAKSYSSPRAAARAYGWNENTYKSHEAGLRGVPLDVIKRYARAFGVTPEWLAFGTGAETPPTPAPLSVPVIGFASGGEEWIPFDDHAQGAGLDELELDIAGADPVAVLVRGHSMSPVYRNGDALICSRERGIDMQNALNRDCVVLTEKGECYFKMVMPGTARGLYRLRSYNPAYQDLDNQRLEWAAPVVWIRRA